MKHTTRFLAPLLIATVLPSMAGADDRTRGYDDASGRSADARYDRDDRYDRYDRSGRYDDGRSLRELARELEGWTRSAYQEARRQYRDRDRNRDRYREPGAVAALDRLAEQSRRFRQEVDRSTRSRSRTERGFDAVRSAYLDASESLRGQRADRRVREVFGRVQNTMDQLAYHYGGSGRDGWRSSDRYRDGERGRYDDRGRYIDGGDDDDDDDRYGERDDDDD